MTFSTTSFQRAFFNFKTKNIFQVNSHIISSDLSLYPNLILIYETETRGILNSLKSTHSHYMQDFDILQAFFRFSGLFISR